jgi:hypothetical protein
MLLTVLRRRIVIVILVGLSIGLFTEQPAQASIPTQNQVTGIIIAIVAIGAGIGIGVYFLVRRPPSLTGCAVQGSSSLTLENETDHQVFMLIGDTPNLKVGERVRVTGKKQKKDASGARTFLVEKLNKDYGACKVSPAPATP